MSESLKARTRQASLWLFHAFVVVCLVDGALDIFYPLARAAKINARQMFVDVKYFLETESASKSKLLLPEAGFPLRSEPGIRNIVAEYHSTKFNVNADGRRDNGQDPPKNVKYTGLLLGSSAAFGYGVADNQTIASHLERTLNGVRIYNYAGLAQTATDHMMRWYDLERRGEKPGVVVVAGVGIQLYEDCKPIASPSAQSAARSNIFVYLAGKIHAGLRSEEIMPCESDDSLDLAIQNSLLSVKSLVEFGRERAVPFHLVYLPSPFDANVNVSNLMEDSGVRDYLLAMQRIFGRYHQALIRLGLPELIDLSQALPPDKMYFLDTGGHLSVEGNRLIAEKLAQHLSVQRSHAAVWQSGGR